VLNVAQAATGRSSIGGVRGFHLTRYSPDGEGCSLAQTWLFPNLYDLLLFARNQGFAEVDPDATDWRAVYGSV
jgi:hypothetical protein